MFLLSVLKTGTCSVCDIQLARGSYACCMDQDYVTSDGVIDCTFFFRQGQCTPGDDWSFGGDSCDKDQFPSVKVTTKDLENEFGPPTYKRRLQCKGRKENTGEMNTFKVGDIVEDPSTYDDNTYLWSCIKPPTPAKQATVILDPPAGNISVKSRKVFLDVTLENGFPEAFSRVELPKGLTSSCRNKKISSDENGLVSTSCQYEITLRSRERLFTLVVAQQGFENRTFQYRATTTFFPRADTGGDTSGYQRKIMGNSGFFILNIFWYNVMTMYVSNN